MARNRKDNIYPIGVILYCRQVFEGRSPKRPVVGTHGSCVRSAEENKFYETLYF